MPLVLCLANAEHLQFQDITLTKDGLETILFVPLYESDIANFVGYRNAVDVPTDLTHPCSKDESQFVVGMHLNASGLISGLGTLNNSMMTIEWTRRQTLSNDALREFEEDVKFVVRKRIILWKGRRYLYVGIFYIFFFISFCDDFLFQCLHHSISLDIERLSA